MILFTLCTICSIWKIFFLLFFWRVLVRTSNLIESKIDNRIRTYRVPDDQRDRRVFRTADIFFLAGTAATWNSSQLSCTILSKLRLFLF